MHLARDWKKRLDLHGSEKAFGKWVSFESPQVVVHDGESIVLEVNVLRLSI